MIRALELARAQPWIAIALFMGAFVILVAGLKLHQRARSPHPEHTRKALHTGAGLLTLSFPFLFSDVWPVLLLTGGSTTLLAAMKFLTPVRQRLGRVVDGVDRRTLGELYFPISVAIVFWLARGHPPLLFCIPVLVLTLADATCALIGLRYGLNRFTGANKSLEGSVAFVVVAFFCIHVPLLLWGDTGRVETLLIALTMALVVMLLEGSAWRGLDNLFIPIGGFFLLRAYLPLGVDELLPRFLVTVALVITVLLSRRSTTLVDDSLLAGAFLCYVTWALAGWRWLVPPAIVFLGYAWFSPRTPDNSRRIHSVAAVLAVWAAAILWLMLARSLGRPQLVYPFTLAFACHLAIFGLSRLAYDYPARPLATLAAVAVGKSWAIVFVPFVLLQGVTSMNVQLALAAGIAIALAAVAFVAIQPGIRHTPLDLSRWVRQAVTATGGSAIGWLTMVALERIA